MENFKFSCIIKTFFIANFVISVFLVSPATPTSSNEVVDQLKEMRLEISQFNRKTGLLDLKNEHQDEEIRSLKNIISQLTVKRNEDEEIKSDQELKDDGGVGLMVRNKRPSSLIHLPHLIGEKSEPFTGSPSNCKDLSKLGHTLNGIFLVKQNVSINPKISIIFCDFQPFISGVRPSSHSIVENHLGFVDMKNSAQPGPRSLTGIYVYVNIGGASLMVPDNSVLKYDHQVLNVGRAMNLMTGVFIAPRAGIYTFAFSMTKNGFNFEYLDIFLRLNGNKVGHSWAGKGLIGMPVTLQSTLKLKKGDRVDLLKGAGGLHAVCSSFCHHFTGWLLEEDNSN